MAARRGRFLVGDVHACDSEEDVGVSYAAVELTPELCRMLLGRRKQFKEAFSADGELDVMHFWNKCVEWYGYCDHEAFAGLGDGWNVVDAGPDEDEQRRTEVDRLVVGKDGFQWLAVETHMDRYFESVEFPWDVVDQRSVELNVAAPGIV